MPFASFSAYLGTPYRVLFDRVYGSRSLVMLPSFSADTGPYRNAGLRDSRLRFRGELPASRIPCRYLLCGNASAPSGRSESGTSRVHALRTSCAFDGSAFFWDTDPTTGEAVVRTQRTGIGLHITLGGAPSTSQIFPKALGNHEDDLRNQSFVIDFQ